VITEVLPVVTLTELVRKKQQPERTGVYPASGLILAAPESEV